MKIEGYEWQSDYAKKLLAEGKAIGEAIGEARGRARVILSVLRSRGLDVSEEAHERIISCTDLEQLERWANLVGIVESTDQLFE
jgi:hypothetical protein